MAVEQDPHSIAIQRAIPAVNDRLRTITSVIQNGQATHAQALCSLEDLLTTRIEQRIESIAGALSEFIGGSFHFVPRGHQLAPTQATLMACPCHRSLLSAQQASYPAYHGPGAGCRGSAATVPHVQDDPDHP
jgi:hypothetical protein